MHAMDDLAFGSRIAEALNGIGGVVGVVLGGSRARGTEREDSDYDFGLYYSDDDALDLGALADAAEELDDERRDGLIAAPGEWGAWVNGGGWLTVNGRRVDIILRDFRRVEQAVADSLAGRVDAHYQAGHPHAFVNVMYAGELAIARILQDDDGRLTRLQETTRTYPDELKRALVGYFDFEAGFSRMLAAAYANADDGYYAAAHVVRSVSCLNQVLFALNREYCLNEKGAVRMIDGFAAKPANYAARIDVVMARSGTDAAAACRELESLMEETRLIFPGEL